MSCYSRANKVCATCAHWGGNRNSVAGGFPVMPTSSTEKIVSRRRADHSYAAVPPQNAAAGGGCNTCVWHSSSDSRRRRSFAQHGTNNPLRLTDPKASTTIYVSPPAAIMAVLNPFGTFCFAVQPFRLPAACAAGAACKTLIGEKHESLNLLKAQPLCPFGKAEAGIAKPP